MATASKDPNRIPTLLGVSNVDGTTPIPVQVDPITGRLLTNNTVNLAQATITIQGALPAGGNTIGSVTILGSLTTTLANNQTVTIAAGTTAISGVVPVNGTVSIGQGTVVVSGAINGGTITIQGALPAGTNLLGSVAINGGVTLAGSLPAGTNLLGSVAINGGVTLAGSLPAGSNLIGTTIVWSNRNLFGKTYTSFYSTTATASIVAAQGASIFADLYGITITNFAASAIKFRISDSDTTNGTVEIWEVPSNDTRGFRLPHYSGIPQGTANAAWIGQTLASGSVEVSTYWIKRT